MEKRLGKRFWAALVIFGLMGQVAWVVENMYFNVFIYKMFHASAADISLMVGAGSVAATVTTMLMGAFTDYMGKRKAFICGGYIAWGISILAFAFIRVDVLAPIAGGALQAAALGITLVIVLDCVMTFLGASANDACFNAWMTDWGDGSNRGKIEGIHSMMPLVAILVVFGGFSVFDLDRAESWTAIYLIVGMTVLVIGILGFFLIDEKGKAGGKCSYKANLVYSFRLSVMKENPLLYAVLGAFAIFGISINIFMPYLILYYEKTLGMDNYVMVMAPAIVLAAVVTAFYGKLFDLLGFKSSVIPVIGLLMAGYVLLYVGAGTGIVFVGSLLMMTGYLTGMAVFGAMIRSHIPEEKAGQFQGIRMISQVLLPGIIGPAIGAAVLHDAEQIVNSDGTTSFLPNRNIYAAALAVALVLAVILYFIFRVMRNGHHRLISQAGEELLDRIAGKGQQGKNVLYVGSQGKDNMGEGAPDGVVSCAGSQERDAPGESASDNIVLRAGSQGKDNMGESTPDGAVSLVGGQSKDNLGEGVLDSAVLCRKSREEDWKVSGDDVIWGKYPRPQMRRNSFFSLNGNWQLNGQRISVPFPPQSLLSGYQGHVGAKLEYSRSFESPVGWKEGRVLLHFGAVDQVAEVFLNGHFAGKHEGGYLPFSCDITEYIQEGENKLVVKAKDTLSPMYPYGKQRKNRGGMWYTPVSGIWQSVWLECVPKVYIRKLDVIADTGKVCVTVVSSEEECRIDQKETPAAAGKDQGDKKVEQAGKECRYDNKENMDIREMAGKHSGIRVSIRLHDGSLYTVHAEGNRAEIDLADLTLEDGTAYRPVLWTTKHPYLYEMTVALGEDTVSSYFGLRTIEIKKVEGVPRVCLNGEPVFLHGVLDQGYYCDGIYLPAQEEEYERDILRMKDLGMNLLRKHIKIEPECFYYYCDVHGMLVMQDMVNSGVYSWIKDTALPTIGVFPYGNGTIWGRKKRRDFFVESMKETIAHLRSHPSVVAYTIFNEGWGQFESDAMYELAKGLDPTRLYDAASGWFYGRKSDFDSQHIYFKKLEIPQTLEKPVLVSECGGFSYGIPGHVFAKFTRFGYGDCADSEELTERIRKLYEDRILPAIPQGVCGCIYTQLSDVEDETNGLYTYDRKVCKVVVKVMKEIGEWCNKALFAQEHRGK